jgi:hypothetical protein
VRTIHCYSIIVSVRETCADWQRGVEPHADPALKGKKDPDNGFGIKVPRRNVGNFFAVPYLLCNTVKHRFNVPAFSEIPDLVMIFSCPDSSSI